jgi:hypothetical protein
MKLTFLLLFLSTFCYAQSRVVGVPDSAKHSVLVEVTHPFISLDSVGGEQQDTLIFKRHGHQAEIFVDSDGYRTGAHMSGESFMDFIDADDFGKHFSQIMAILSPKITGPIIPANENTGQPDLGAWVITPNQPYTRPQSPWELAGRIDSLEARIKILESKVGIKK